jgi:hypothetical protein
MFQIFIFQMHRLDNASDMFEKMYHQDVAWVPFDCKI